MGETKETILEWLERAAKESARKERERKERLDTLYARARRLHQAQQWQAGYRASQMGNTRGGNTTDVYRYCVLAS